ncbi:hypothetical protein E2C01_056944 [Portunus trituberculatus]|uniref:Uncharacterized protein n=1 Tax=Portunus trituberculatus TaxID=210409 RepID=A0A5B7H1Z8_PORTR|nr:hypothetical protein [Portunus trituberculatus]
MPRLRLMRCGCVTVPRRYHQEVAWGRGRGAEGGGGGVGGGGLAVWFYFTTSPPFTLFLSTSPSQPPSRPPLAP